MDIFAHALWAGAGARKLNDALEGKHKPGFSIGWATFWGIFPDLLAFSYPFSIRILSVLSGNLALVNFFQRPPIVEEAALRSGFNIAGILYPYGHSLIIFSAVFAIAWLIYKRPVIAMLGWGLHILIDIFTHSAQFYPTPFLFPISSYRFLHGIAWSNQWFMIINYSALLLVFLYFLLRKKNSPR